MKNTEKVALLVLRARLKLEIAGFKGKGTLQACRARGITGNRKKALQEIETRIANSQES